MPLCFIPRITILCNHFWTNFEKNVEGNVQCIDKGSWEDVHYGQKNVQSSAWLTCPRGSFLNNLTHKKANALVHFGQQLGTAWLRSKRPASRQSHVIISSAPLPFHHAARLALSHIALVDSKMVAMRKATPHMPCCLPKIACRWLALLI